MDGIILDGMRRSSSWTGCRSGWRGCRRRWRGTGRPVRGGDKLVAHLLSDVPELSVISSSLLDVRVRGVPSRPSFEPASTTAAPTLPWICVNDRSGLDPVDSTEMSCRPLLLRRFMMAPTSPERHQTPQDANADLELDRGDHVPVAHRLLEHQRSARRGCACGPARASGVLGGGGRCPSSALRLRALVLIQNRRPPGSTTVSDFKMYVGSWRRRRGRKRQKRGVGREMSAAGRGETSVS